MRAAIESFLSSCRQPVVMDFGDRPIELLSGRYALEDRAGRLSIEAWNEERSLSRHILQIDRIGTGVLECTVQRFGGVTGRLTFLDQQRPQAAARALRGERQNFAEEFRRMLQRQFAGWEISSLSSALDLRRSFSTNFPRALLKRGTRRMAALACASPEEEPAFLTSALLWLDAVRARGKEAGRASLCLFLPEDAGALTAHRLRWLTGIEFETRLFRYNQHGLAGEVDAADLGNLDTRVSSHYCPMPAWPGEITAALSRLRLMPGVGCCPEIGGAVSIRFRGLEFARLEYAKAWLGIGSRQELAWGDFSRVESFAAHLASIGDGSPGNEQHRDNCLPAFAERWFESAVRKNIRLLDAALLPTPIHAQVLTFAGMHREMVDFLAISDAGRLCVLELKTSEDLHLPLQALDYWIRVGWHAGRGELASLFPGIALSNQTAKLLLVAPALSFHPSNEIVLRYFSPVIEVERVGVNSEWGHALKVVLRLRGGEPPISHQGADELRRIDQH